MRLTYRFYILSAYLRFWRAFINQIFRWSHIDNTLHLNRLLGFSYFRNSRNIGHLLNGAVRLHLDWLDTWTVSRWKVEKPDQASTPLGNSFREPGIDMIFIPKRTLLQGKTP